MYFNIAYIILGLVGLWFFSDKIVESAKRVAHAMGLSSLFIGLTIVSIGTSLPEIATNIMAGISTLKGVDSSGIAVGNIVGSEISQITLILGIVGAMTVLKSSRKELLRDGFAMLMAIIALFLASFGGINRIEAALLIILYVVYIYHLIREEKVKTQIKSREKPCVWDFIVILGGSGFLFISSSVVVTNGVFIAQLLDVSKYIIGLFVGLGTSFPELAVSITGVVKGSKGISLGNLIGSNITDPLLSLGLGAIICGFSVDKQVLYFDIPFLFVSTLIVLWMLKSETHLGKKEAIILIGLYLFFMGIKLSGII